MSECSLGIIETIGLAAAVEAADVCVKSANVTLVGYELSKGDGMTVVKIEGDVGAVKAAIEAAQISAAKVNKVVSAKIIPRPSTQIDMLIRNTDTVGLEHDDAKSEEIKEETVEVDSAIPLEQVNSIDTIDEIEEAVELDNVNSEIKEELTLPEKADEEIKEEIKEVEIEDIKAEDTQKKDRYTCNICKDPKCPRLKGELKSTCIHYKK
nr:BMC domain-containing protein [Sedimentibacter sp.]